MTYQAEVQTPPELRSTNREWHETDISKRHFELLARPHELQHLIEDRGLSLSTIKRFKIGYFSPGVYMIPVYDAAGNVLNVRYYRRTDHKKWGVKGKTTKIVFPLLGMNGANPLWICEGEFDCMMAIQNGIHAVTTTAGAPATPATLRENRDVFGETRRFILAFDNDEAGYKAAAEIGLDVFPGRIDGVVRWPENFRKDISDWYNQGHTTAELESLVVPWSDEWARGLLKRSTDLIEIAEAGGMREPGEDDPEKAQESPAQESPKVFDRQTMWPKTGFLSEYLDYACSMTDAPDQFHAAAALTILGTAANRRVYFPLGINRIYTNFYTALIAPSSVFRKSTSIKIAATLLHLYRPELSLPREFSTERFLIHLARVSSRGLLYYSELAELLDQFKRSYSEGLLAILTDFFDCPNKYERETQKDGLQTVTEPFISILSASTVDWINKNITAEHSEGGFWPRFLFFPARVRKPINECPVEGDTLKRDTLIYMLKEFESVDGRMSLSEEADKAYRAFVRQTDEQSACHPLGPSFVKYLSRMQIYAIKIAMLYELSETRSLTISGEAMTRALVLVGWLIEELAYMHEHEIAHNANEANEQKLYRMVKERGEMSERDAMRAMRLSAKLFRSLVESLEAKEYIQRVHRKAKGNGKGRPSVVLSVTKIENRP